jgi:long-chain alkane monooxygenase
VTPKGALVFMSGWMGVDLARYGLDEPIGNVDSNAILSAVKAFQSADPDGREWAVRDTPSGRRDRRHGTTIIERPSTVPSSSGSDAAQPARGR